MANKRLDLDLQAELDRHRRAVDTDYFDLSLRELIRMIQEREIRIAPEYQRQFRWSDETQSALIESFLLGLPVPAVFVATNADGTWEVVDGLQRICTALRFLALDAPESSRLAFSKNPLKLQNLKTIDAFEGLSYQDLPRPIQLTFDRRYMRVQVLSDKSDTEVRFELFRRLNQGAIALTAQEIRACIFQGPFNNLLAELARYEHYRHLLKLKSIDKGNGTAEEVVLKLFAYMDEADHFDGRVTAFLNDYMRDHQNESDVASYRELFIKVTGFLSSIVAGAFLRTGTSTTPINQFEAVLAGIGLIYREGKTPRVPTEDWVNDAELIQYSTKGTNSRSQLTGRINRARAIFEPQ
jgi:Protein of unknown function DUF262